MVADLLLFVKQCSLTNADRKDFRKNASPITTCKSMEKQGSVTRQGQVVFNSLSFKIHLAFHFLSSYFTVEDKWKLSLLKYVVRR